MKKCLCCFVLGFIPLPAWGQEPEFIRLRQENGKPIALEVAITRYAHKDVTVDLIGVVHVADRAYYRELAKRFPQYDAVLYELVAPEGTRPTKAGKQGSTFALVHQVMKAVLDLDSQMSCIDYSKGNFIHADLDWDGMMAAAQERGDDGLTLGLSITADMLRKANLDARNPKQLDMVEDWGELLASPVRLKQLFARQMVDNLGSGLGPTIETLLVADRNKKALGVLSRQVVDGKKKLALFYGAAHCPDFDRRLRKDFGLERGQQEWLTAWNMAGAQDADPAIRLLKLLLED